MIDESVRDLGDCSIRVSDTRDDPAWDEFLARAPGTPMPQTSYWARARAYLGWDAVRVVVSEAERIVGGAQVLLRPLPAMGLIGFARKGPVVPPGRPDLAELIIREMMAMAKAREVQYLVVQPPRGSDWVLDDLARAGFRACSLDMDHYCVLVDLRVSCDELLARMSRRIRSYAKSEERKNLLTIRRGSEDDLPILSSLKDAHSARLGYARRDDGYYAELWHAFAPPGHMVLFIAEYEGEPLSALLTIPFGNTVRFMEWLWSGEHPERQANSLLLWYGFQWAKSEGFQFADLGAVPPEFAEAALSGADVRRDPKYSAYSDAIYKLKLGGEVISDPAPLDYVFNPALRVAYRCVPNAVMSSNWLMGLVSKLKGSGT